MTRLQEIRNSLPKYRYLTPKVDKWQDGDEWFSYGYDDETGRDYEEWCHNFNNIGKLITTQVIARRPYSEEYLDSMAFWIRLQEMAGSFSMPVYEIIRLLMAGQKHGYLTLAEIEELGGEERIIAEFEKGFGWLKENLP